jgi:prolycopene isomerase
MLDSYFTDSRLKSVLSTVLLGLVGTFPSQLSAFVGSMIYREFIFDGGYYPVGGIQRFPDILLEKYIEYGGEAIFSKKVDKIEIENNRVKGIVLNDKRYMSSKYVISACDARETFFELIDRNKIDKNIVDKLNSMIPSLSAFLLYLGLDRLPEKISELGANIWVITNYHMETIISNLLNCKSDFFAITSPYVKNGCLREDKTTLCLSTIAPYKNGIYWTDDIKNKFAERLLKMAEEVIPNLSESVVLKVIASPYTLYKWTYNYQGAAYGWASTVSQFCDPDISQKTKIENLYLAGHWTNLSSGITSVINCAYDTTDLILQKEKI